MTTDLFNLSGKTALVSGASRGIGESIAKLLAAQGAHVVLVSRKIDSLKAVEDDIHNSGGQATSLACHTGELDQIQALFDEVKSQFGKLDILVNNAATNPYFGPVLETPPSAFDKTVDVNLKGYFFMSQAGAQLMKDSGGGAIVNVSSVNAIHPPPMQGVYSVTKAGVIAMTKSFANELAPYKIRVNALVPGLTDTKFASAMTQNPEMLKQILSAVPMNRMAQPDEMAGAVLYLVSDASTYTTGMYLTVDGGLTS